MARQRKRGMKGRGSVFQRKDGRWVAQFIVEETGQPKQLYAATEAKAYEKLDKALQEQKKGILATGPQQKLKDYLEYWLEEVHRPTIRESTYANYRSILDKHIFPTLGHIQLQKLTVQHIQSFYALKRKEGLKPRTIKVYHAVLHNALAHAVFIGLIGRNVCDYVTKSLPKAMRYEPQTLNEEQAQALIEKVQGHRLETLLTLALTTGMRRGELVALRWQDVNLEMHYLQVLRSARREGGFGLRVNEPKTQAGRRKIALSPFLVAALKQHHSQQLEIRLRVGTLWEDHDLVFPNRRGNFLDPNYVRVVFQRLLKEIGLPHMRFHDLRHSAATLLYQFAVCAKI